MKADYVQAVLELLRDNVEVSDIVAGLTKTMERRRQLPLLRPVLARVLVVLEASDATSAVATVANEHAVETLKAEIAHSLKLLGAEAVPLEVQIDESLIGGSVVRYRHQAVDTSYKQALVSLYRSLTTK